jgi:hypothetical protein
MDVCKAVCQKTAELRQISGSLRIMFSEYAYNIDNTKHRVPCSVPIRLLRTSIPANRWVRRSVHVSDRYVRLEEYVSQSMRRDIVWVCETFDRRLVHYTYHICTIAINVGATDASKEPRTKRAAINPPKLRAAVMPHSVAPQQKTITAQNLPIGNLTKK